MKIKNSIIWLLIVVGSCAHQTKAWLPYQKALHWSGIAANFAIGYTKQLNDFYSNKIDLYYNDEYLQNLPDLPQETQKYLKKILEQSSLTAAQKEKIRYKIFPHITNFAVHRSATQNLTFLANEDTANFIVWLEQKNDARIWQNGVPINDDHKNELKNIYNNHSFLALHEARHLEKNDSWNQLLSIPIAIAGIQTISSLTYFSYKNTRIAHTIRQRPCVAFAGNIAAGLLKYFGVDLLYVLNEQRREKRADRYALAHFTAQEDLESVKGLWQFHAIMYQTGLNDPNVITHYTSKIPGYASYLLKKHQDSKDDKPFGQWLAEKHPYHYAFVEFVHDPRHPSFASRIKYVEQRKKELFRMDQWQKRFDRMSPFAD